MAYFIQQTLVFCIPLMIVALAGVFAERSGIINIALEGIMIVGAFIGVLRSSVARASMELSKEIGLIGPATGCDVVSIPEKITKS